MTHASDSTDSLIAAAEMARAERGPTASIPTYKGACAAEQVELQALAAVEAAMPHPCPWLEPVEVA